MGNELELGKGIFIKQDGVNVTLFRKIEKDVLNDNKEPTGEKRLVSKDIGYYGTIYQALQSVVRGQYDISEDLMKQYEDWVYCIDMLEADIKKRFRIEVKA
jgi:hypothetical protein